MCVEVVAAREEAGEVLCVTEGMERHGEDSEKSQPATKCSRYFNSEDVFLKHFTSDMWSLV